MEQSLKPSQRPNFKGEELPEELRSPRRQKVEKEEEPVESSGFLEWLTEILPIFLAGLGMGLFLFYLFSPASVVEMAEEMSEAM
jgi:hypothetical protein